MPAAKLIIDTANSVPSFWGTSIHGDALHGFQSGNLTGGVQPTELSADWCNAIQMELANAIEPYASAPLANGGMNLSNAIDAAFIAQRPVRSSSVTFTFASQTPAAAVLTGGSLAGGNVVRRRTASRGSIAANVVQDVVSMALPTNSQALLRFSVSIVQTDNLAVNYHHSVRFVAARNVAGVVTQQDVSVTYLFNAGITYAITLVSVASSVVLRVTPPAIPAGKIHNAMGYCELISVHNTP